MTTLAGVLLALGRRYVFRRERLDPSFDAGFILCLIGFLMATDLLAGAATIALTPGHASAWEPVTAALSTLFAGTAPATLQALYVACWWIHLVDILFFGNYLPYSKHFHIITAIPNVFFMKLDAHGAARHAGPRELRAASASRGSRTSPGSRCSTATRAPSAAAAASSARPR